MVYSRGASYSPQIGKTVSAPRVVPRPTCNRLIGSSFAQFCANHSACLRYGSCMVDKEVLSPFPRPHVAVDVAVLTVVPAEVSVTGLAQLAVLVEQRDSPRRPGPPRTLPAREPDRRGRGD